MTLPFGNAGFATASTLQDKLLTLLGEYGAYVPSYELPDYLNKMFGSAVDETACQTALNALILKGRVSRSAEQPAMVMIAEVPGRIVLPPLPKNEAEIMPHLEHYLRGAFQSVIEGQAGLAYKVVDTSHRGPATGTWRRPDFTVVNVIDLRLFGRRQIDVHSIELKTETGCTVPSVFEALSQARETHYAYLAWDLPEESSRRLNLPEIEAACILHGIGLIIMTRRGREGIGHLRIRPQRRTSSDLDVHRYLLDRLDKQQIDWLMSAVGQPR